mmetsp:Transcript_22889/g.39010  ORF Transcript_22889/g.39010 Transcript_22889/m.39010 type:complete len:97 (+) Transcript_22889:1113-1403(+)
MLGKCTPSLSRFCLTRSSLGKAYLCFLQEVLEISVSMYQLKPRQKGRRRKSLRSVENLETRRMGKTMLGFRNERDRRESERNPETGKWEFVPPPVY